MPGGEAADYNVPLYIYIYIFDTPNDFSKLKVGDYVLYYHS